MQPFPEAPDHGAALLGLYDDALPQVYGYLLRRCDAAPLAEDLTAETFLAAVDGVRRGTCPTPPTTGWLIGIARHKLADHWRRRERDLRDLRLVGADRAVAAPTETDPWDERLDALHARETLTRLAGQHRAVLVLRHVDDLPVPEVAAVLGRTVHATEALLVRARRAFRRAYGEEPA